MRNLNPVYQMLGLALPWLLAGCILWVALSPFSEEGLTVFGTLYAVGYIIATAAVIVATLYAMQLHQPTNNEAPSLNLNGKPKMTEKQEAPKKAEKKEVPKKEVPFQFSVSKMLTNVLMWVLMKVFKKVATVHQGVWIDDCVFLTFYEIPKRKPGEKNYEYGRFHYFYRKISLDELNKMHPNIHVRPGPKRVFYKLKPEKLAEWKLAKDEIGHDPKLPRFYSDKQRGICI